jgi:hypothetical protein
MDNWQRNIAIGTVLGGSSLIKPSKGVNYYLSMRSTHSLWLQYKMEELRMFFPKKELKLEKNTYRCRSSAHAELTNLHGLMYKGFQRVVSNEILHPMRDIGLAVWYLDSGGRCGRNNKNVYLNTTKLQKTGTEKVLKYFKEMSLDCSASISSGRTRILFSVPASEKFIRIIEAKIQPYMLDCL